MYVDFKTQVYELLGNAGTICGMRSDEATIAYMTMSDEELNKLMNSVCSKSGRVINWYAYLKSYGEYNPGWKKAYQEYRKSPAWKRKRDVVMQLAMRSKIPENPKIRRSRDSYGRVIASIECERIPMCQEDGCTKIAEHVHHKHYRTVGKEDIIKDLEALCKGCHYKK